MPGVQENTDIAENLWRTARLLRNSRQPVQALQADALPGVRARAREVAGLHGATERGRACAEAVRRGGPAPRQPLGRWAVRPSIHCAATLSIATDRSTHWSHRCA